MYYYRIYELIFSAPFQCTMLTPIKVSVPPDVEIIEGTVAKKLDNFVVQGVNWQASPGLFLFRGGNHSARFLVESGTRIVIERNKGAEEKKVCAHLLSIVMAALLRQRGLLVLHANAVMTPKGAVLITGNTGAGKSTTQAGLLQHGCRMITDDITVVKISSDDNVMIIPGFPKMNLCEDAAVKLGHSLSNLQRNPLRNIKVIVPHKDEQIYGEPVALKAIYYLRCEPVTKVVKTETVGINKFSVLQDGIYGPLFPEEHYGVFQLIAKILSNIPISLIDRPGDRWSVNEVAEVILNG